MRHAAGVVRRRPTTGTIDATRRGRVLVDAETLALIGNGRPMRASVARPADGVFALALTPPFRLG